MNAHAVLVLGELKGAARTAVEQAHREASVEPTFAGTVDQAVAALDQKPWRALVADLTTPGASRFCHEARGRRSLFNVPLIGMTPKLTDLAFANALRWGADDVVALGAAEPLRTRLSATPYRVMPVATASRGDAVIADPDQARCDVLGRVLANAGFNVKYALDAVTTRFFALKTSPELVVLNADVLEARALIEEAQAAGKRTRWIVSARQQNVEALNQELARLTSVAVMGSHGPPENALFYANLLNPSAEARRRSDLRALHGTLVLFRSVGDERDECGFTYSVSANGLYIRTLLPPPAKDVWLEITPAGQARRVRLAGRVAWSRTFGQPGAETAPPGFGLRIVDGLGEDLALWEAGFRLLAPSAPESARATENPAPFRIPMPSLTAPRPSLSPQQRDAAVIDRAPTSVPSLPGRFGTRPPGASSMIPSVRAALNPASIAPMPVLSSAPPVNLSRAPAPRAQERAARPPAPSSNDDRGRTVLGMGIPADIRGSDIRGSDIRGSSDAPPPNPGMEPADLAKLLADAGLLDTPSPAGVAETAEAANPNPPDNAQAPVSADATATSESDAPRPTISLSPGDLESLPPGAPTELESIRPSAIGETRRPLHNGSSRPEDSVIPPSVSEVLDRIFDPGHGAVSNGQVTAEGSGTQSPSDLAAPPEVPEVDPFEATTSVDALAETRFAAAATSSAPSTATASASAAAGSANEEGERAATGITPKPVADVTPEPQPPAAAPAPAGEARETSGRLAVSSAMPASIAAPAPSPSRRGWVLGVVVVGGAVLAGALTLKKPAQRHSDNHSTPQSSAPAALPNPSAEAQATSDVQGTATEVAAAPSSLGSSAASSEAASPSTTAESTTAESTEVSAAPSALPSGANSEATSKPAASITSEPVPSGPRVSVASGTVPALVAAVDAPEVPGDAAQLPEDSGYLFVRSTADASVFVHGVDFGKTNRWIRTKCGLRFVRLGTEPGKWLSVGLPTRLRCRAGNVVELNP